LNNIIIGTAGHIDHGKTTLIKALTGRNTDRLKEEQRRGISIELGFTYFDLPDGRRAGIIDVSGHEKFIKNMLAGVGGMDMVLLVVAADEGIMPQTTEHLNILDMIRIKKGIVVLTKADMVEEEWLEMVIEEVKENIKGTFLEGAPVIPVSSVTGAGIDTLVKTIGEMTEELNIKNYDSLYRLNIDRAFSITGFGTIVTGTLISGKVEEGQRVCIYPAGIEGRIRNLQVHDQDVEAAYAGQRLAVNIAGVKRDQIQRGDVIAPAGALQPTMMLDCRLRLVKDTDWTVDNRGRVRLHIGTKEILCRVVLLDKEQLGPGEECYAQLRLEEEAVALRGDRFVIRSYSPMEAIGGGTVLEPNPPKRKRYNKDTMEELKLKESGSPLQVLEKVISLNSSFFPGRPKLIELTGKSEEELQPMLSNLVDSGTVREFQSGSQKVYIHKEYFSGLLLGADSLLREFHARYPLRSGMPVEEFRSKLFGSHKGTFIDEVLRSMEKEGTISVTSSAASLSGFKIQLTQDQQGIRGYILDLLERKGYSPPGIGELLQGSPYGGDETAEVLDMLVESGEIKRIGEDTVFLKGYYEGAVESVVEHIRGEGSISLATLRDHLGTSRKYAMALLEEMDRDRITKRVGDNRVLYGRS
jgi:selenocysteine-specific elongation factor